MNLSHSATHTFLLVSKLHFILCHLKFKSTLESVYPECCNYTLVQIIILTWNVQIRVKCFDFIGGHQLFSDEDQMSLITIESWHLFESGFSVKFFYVVVGWVLKTYCFGALKITLIYFKILN